MVTFQEFVLLSESNVTPFLKFYRTVGKGDWKTAHQPDDAVLWECLTILEKYYREYLQWYAKVRPKLRPREDIVISQYHQRHRELTQALQSSDPQVKMQAIDNGINQWHIDFPAIYHLEMEAEGNDDEDGMSKEEQKDWHELSDILVKLGKLSTESPHAPPRRNKR